MLKTKQKTSPKTRERYQWFYMRSSFWLCRKTCGLWFVHWRGWRRKPSLCSTHAVSWGTSWRRKRRKLKRCKWFHTSMHTYLSLLQHSPITAVLILIQILNQPEPDGSMSSCCLLTLPFECFSRYWFIYPGNWWDCVNCSLGFFFFSWPLFWSWFDVLCI